MNKNQVSSNFFKFSVTSETFALQMSVLPFFSKLSSSFTSSDVMMESQIWFII